MAVIDVKRLDDEHFEVQIDEGSSSTMHIVTATAKHVELLCDGCDPARLVEASMRFLLDHEPKESIMNQFDLDLIASFFPDYHATVQGYL